MLSHFFKSHAKLLLVVASMRLRANSDSTTKAQPGVPVQPFCGALTSTSTPVAAMSTHIAPDAMQSNTNMPPTLCMASATARKYTSGKMMPDAVSTWGANTKSGLSRKMVATTSSMVAGAYGDCLSGPFFCAFNTVLLAGIFPISKICVQR